MVVLSSFASRLRSHLSSRISRRLVVHVLAGGLAFTLATVAVFAFREYRSVEARKRSDLDLIRSGYLQPITASLYKMDAEQLAGELQSLRHLPSIAWLRVEDDLGTGFSVAVGEVGRGTGAVERIELVHPVGGRPTRIGVLRVGVRGERFSQGFRSSLLGVLLASLAFGLFVTAYFLFIFDRTVVSHLLQIADFAKRRDLFAVGPRLALDRQAHDADELDTLVESLNAMLSRIEADVEERTRSQAALAESEMKFRSYVERSPEGIFVLNEHGCYVEVNPAAAALTGYSQAELLGMCLRDLTPEDAAPAASSHFEALRRVGTARGEFPYLRKGGERCWWMLDEVKLSETRYLGIAVDTTERRRAEEEKAGLQEQLLQSQKLESVGKLAGGVAHDFNNMLSVILGYSEIGLAVVDPETKVHGYFREITRAAKRSAEVTQQLLGFARKQMIAPKVVCIDEFIDPMLNIIRRLIGEDIDVVWRPGDGLAKVLIDPSQLHQVVTNLATNARDAVDGGGRVVIETGSEFVSEADSSARPDTMPGRYVTLTVSDDGAGIDPAHLPHIFDPFFTTKELGKGTGLGLATVFGIVRQNGGFLDVHSELGRGATFRVFLPQVEEASPTEEVRTSAPRAGTETILVAEDEQATLDMIRDYLAGLGYRVLAASDPREASALGKREGKIDLVLTDVVMPGMNGRQLADELRAANPGLRCLFMSGYTADILARHGSVDREVDFLQKPYALQDLAAKIRELLDRPLPGSGEGALP